MATESAVGEDLFQVRADVSADRAIEEAGYLADSIHNMAEQGMASGIDEYGSHLLLHAAAAMQALLVHAQRA